MEVRGSVVRSLTVTGWTLSPSRLVNITGRRTGKAQRVDTINMVRPDLSQGSLARHSEGWRAIVIIPTRNIEIHFRPSEPRTSQSEEIIMSGRKRRLYAATAGTSVTNQLGLTAGNQ